MHSESFASVQKKPRYTIVECSAPALLALVQPSRDGVFVHELELTPLYRLLSIFLFHLVNCSEPLYSVDALECFLCREVMCE